MTWIATTSPEEATGNLKQAYDHITELGGKVDNISMAHALRPHTLEGHLALAKSILNHFGNKIEKWLMETIGVYTSLLNGCVYCTELHFRRLAQHLGDEKRAAEIRAALEAGEPERALGGRVLAAIYYAEKLTRSPRAMAERDIEALRKAGYDDGEILEINQVVSYFAYANRTILGLGIKLDDKTASASSPSSPNDRDLEEKVGEEV